MKKRTSAVLFAALFVALLLPLACTTQNQSEPGGKAGSQETVLRGMVKIYGNEPHTEVGIETVPGGKVYAVRPPEKAEELRAMQGRLLEFTVTIRATRMPGLEGTATVLSWR